MACDKVGGRRASSDATFEWRRWAQAGLIAVGSVVVSGVLVACGGGGDSSSSTTSSNTLSAQAALGAKIFSDESLSRFGQQSCASCHDATRAFAGPDLQHGVSAGVVEPGGAPLGAQHGTRVSPSIRYLTTNKAFRFESDGTPTGGFFWDGRAISLSDQAGQPFLNPREMANNTKAEVVAKLAAAAYASEFKSVFGANVFDDVDGAYTRMTLAIAAFENESSDFKPFTSKYDAYLRNEVKLSDAEMRGLALFNNPTKGNCAACHPSARGSDGSFPLFTDFSFDNLGVPRNWDITSSNPTNDDDYDLGLCKSVAVDGVAQSKKDGLCGAFKVPSLRNVAVRKAFFHNGRFTDLKQALTFYVQRDTNPEKWYLKADGVTLDDKFNDLPSQYRGNVNRTEVPYNRNPGDQPALSDTEIDDLVTFLHTLTDGYTH